MLLAGGKKIFGFFLIICLAAAAGGFFYSAGVAASSLDLTVTVTQPAVQVCGNGTIEAPEACDNGSSNGVCPATCSASCTSNSCGGTGPTSLAISAVTSTNITASGATIGWTTNREALCSLRYGLDTSYASSTIAESASSTSHSINLSGLSIGTIYHYKINCADSLGMTASTGDNTFSTLAEIIIPEPLVISNLAATNITANSVDLGWDTNRPAICQSRWGTNTDYSTGASSEITYLSAHLSPLADLAANTTYHYIIDCHDSSGLTATSGDRHFRTLAGPDVTPPANVSGLRAQSGNATSTLFWRNPADTDFAGVIIRRALGFFPSITQGTAVYDGVGNPIGSEMSFNDSGLTNDTTYYYTVFSYDANRNYASGVGVTARPSLHVTPPPTCDSDPSLCPSRPPTCATDPTLCPPPGGQTGDLFFTDFNFSQQGQALAVGSDNKVTAQPDYDIAVSLPLIKILPDTDKMVLNLSIGGKLETYLFTYNGSSKIYSTIIPAIKDVGVYYVSIIALNAQNQSLKIVSGSIEIKAPEVKVLPSLPETVSSTVNAIEDINKAVRANPAVQAVSQAVATPAGQTAAAATVAVSFASAAVSIPLLNWWFLIQFFFTQPLRLLRFRKGWGTVYNAVTKRPVDLALVRLFDAKTNQIISSRVTDSHGRYVFLVNPGEYYIKVEKAGFDYPSVLLNRAHDDGSFLDLYYGEKIGIGGADRSAIIANIPIDQKDVQLTDAEILRKFSRARLSRSLSWLGPILAFGYFLFAPSIFSGSLIVVHLLLLFLFRRLAGGKSKKHWGVVYATDGRHPVRQAITRIFSAEYGRMLEFYVTDDKGRYDFLVGNNKYYVTADKAGYGTAKTPIIDLTGKKPEDLVIAQDLILPAEGETAAPAEEPAAASPEVAIEQPPEPAKTEPETPTEPPESIYG